MKNAARLFGCAVLMIGLGLSANRAAHAMNSNKSECDVWEQLTKLKIFGANFMDKHVQCIGSDLNARAAEHLFTRMKETATKENRYSFFVANAETAHALGSTSWKSLKDGSVVSPGEKLAGDTAYVSTEKLHYVDVTLSDEGEKALKKARNANSWQQVQDIFLAHVKIEPKEGNVTLTTIGGGSKGAQFNHWGNGGK